SRTAEDRCRVARHDIAVYFGERADDAARRDGQAGAPAERAAGNVEPARLAAPLVPAVAGDFDELRRLLADDGVNGEVRLAGARADVILARRQLHHRPHGDRRRILAPFRQQVDLSAEVEITDVVPGPVLVHSRIAVDDAADRRIRGDEQRVGIAIDAGVEQEGAEDFGAVLDTDAKGAGEVADVGVALLPVGAAPVG